MADRGRGLGQGKGRESKGRVGESNIRGEKGI